MIVSKMEIKIDGIAMPDMVEDTEENKVKAEAALEGAEIHIELDGIFFVISLSVQAEVWGG